MPAAARGTSEKSAMAFVRHWVDTLNYAGTTGDTSELNELSGSACKSCVGIINKIDRVYAHGGYFRGEGWSIKSIGAVEGQPAEEPVLEVGVLLAEQELLERKAAEIQHFDGGKQPTIFRLSRSGNWLVMRIDEVQ